MEKLVASHENSKTNESIIKRNRNVKNKIKKKEAIFERNQN